jgi:PAS domain S-box-containing protein
VPRVRRLVVPEKGRLPTEIATPQLFASVPDPFFVLDAHGSVLHASAVWSEIAGREPSNIVGCSWREIVPESGHERVAAQLASLSRSPDGRLREDLSLRDSTGVVRIMDVVVRRVELSELGAVTLFSGREVTLQRQAEADLRAQERHHRQMLEEDLTGSYATGPDGRLVECNSTFLALLGFSSFEEAFEIDTLEFYPDPEERIELIHRLAAGERIGHRELELRRRNGELVHVVENLVADFDEDRNLVELRAYLFDITPQVRLAREREELLIREKAAREQAEAAERRAAFLAELGSLLDASRD